MAIGFIRHGQTDWNANGLFQGSSDTPLNATGEGQARDAAERLRAAGVDYHVVVSSPLSRARRTAQLIAEALDLPLAPAIPLLVERDYGIFEGLPSNEHDKTHASVEPLPEVVARGLAAVEQIRTEHANLNVLAIAHGTIIRYTLAEIARAPLPPIRNGAIATVVFDGAGARVTEVNDAPFETFAERD